MAMALGTQDTTRACGVNGSSVKVTRPALFRPETCSWSHFCFLETNAKRNVESRHLQVPVPNFKDARVHHFNQLAKSSNKFIEHSIYNTR